MNLDSIVPLIKKYGSLEKVLLCLDDDERIIFLSNIKDYFSLCAFFKDTYIDYSFSSKLFKVF